MKVNFKKSTAIVTYSDIKPGEMFTTPKEGGLFVKLFDGESIVVEPLTLKGCDSSVKIGGDPCFARESVVVRLVGLTVEV